MAINSVIDEIFQANFENAIPILCYGTDDEKGITREFLYSYLGNVSFRAIKNRLTSAAIDPNKLKNCPTLNSYVTFRGFLRTNPTIEDIQNYPEDECINSFRKLKAIVLRTGWVERMVESKKFTPAQNHYCRCVQLLASGKAYDVEELISKRIEFFLDRIGREWEGILFYKSHIRMTTLKEIIDIYESQIRDRARIPKSVFVYYERLLEELKPMSTGIEMEIYSIKYHALKRNHEQLLNTQKYLFNASEQKEPHHYFDVITSLLSLGRRIEARRLIVNHYETLFPQIEIMLQTFPFHIYGKFLYGCSLLEKRIEVDYFSPLQRFRRIQKGCKTYAFKPPEYGKECIYCFENIGENVVYTMRCVDCDNFLGHNVCARKWVGDCPLCRK